ncbi:MAG: low molecular weight phosphotyrosine protein phosphatase [Alphaproteobacteria bacterium]|nr:MAG: low molecular weight phosphotyrosine protein phosphatase [Alphaproteobacteria bacterium]
MVKVLFVCLGNICRSPLAEGVFRHRALSVGLTEGPTGHVLADSAGTGSWHVGSPPDERSVRVARKYGIDITGQRARQVSVEDFEIFDYVLAMDRDNLRTLRELAPAQHHDKLSLLLDYAANPRFREVPDPYLFRDEAGFERVFSVIAEGVEGLLAHIRRHHLSG